VNPPPSNPEKHARLRDIQRAFATGIMRPLTAAEGMQPEWTDGRKTEDAVGAFIKPNDRLTSFERLEIYNRQYWYRLLDCFHEDFPGLRTLMGDKRFTALAEAYLTKYRSNSFTLRDLGNRLDRFLREEPDWIKSYPKLAHDLVALEWAHIMAFDSEALPPLEIDQLLGQDPTTLRLTLQPHLTLLVCDYPVDEYVLAVRRRDEPQGEASNAVAERVKKAPAKKVTRPKSSKTRLAIHRHENAVYYKRLDPAAYALLTQLRDGATLQAACEQALVQFPQPDTFAATLQGWFAQWSTFGWFCLPSENLTP
jgi:hypothetical protein